ncbi:sialoadhesin-like isoform X2 [Argopecten irradians]
MVTVGSMLWLTCTFDLDGGTLGQLTWRYQDGGIVGSALPTASPPCSTFGPELYIVDCDDLISNKVRLGIRHPVHNDTYNCSVYLSNYTLIGPVSTQVYVIVPVTSVEIQPQTEGSIDIIENLQTQLTCVTNTDRPPARIYWSVGGLNLTSNSVSTVKSTAGGLYSTSSTLTFITKRHMDGEELMCSASNTGEHILANQTLVIKIMHVPDLSVFPTKDPFVVIEGQTNVTLTCVVTGAYPPITYLRWTKNGTTVSNTGVFNFPAITPMHAGIFTCSAYNGVGTPSSKNVTLNILSSPTKPNIIGFTEVTSSTLTVEWKPSNHGYMANIFTITHGCLNCTIIESSFVNMTDSKTYSATLTKLVPQSLYSLNITAVNKAGPSSPLELVVSTPADTCPTPLQRLSPSSVPLLVVGVILITVAVAVFGVSIFIYRKSRSRSGNQQDIPKIPVKFSRQQQPTIDRQQGHLDINQGNNYQELDPNDFSKPSPYEFLPEGGDESSFPNDRDRYEPVDIGQGHAYLQVCDEGNIEYANT